MHCILHIGTEKTATTLLQQWLYANRSALSAEGICLSTVAKEGNNRKLVSWCQNNVDDWLRRKGIHSLHQKNEFLGDFEHAFRDEAARAKDNHHTMILTSEHFHSRLHADDEIKRLQELLASLCEKVTVVAYFRDQADMAVSLYSTLLKIAFVKPLDRYLGGVEPGKRNFDHARTSQQWAAIFGEDNCRFRVFDRAEFPLGDIRRDFIQSLPIPPTESALDFALERANESLSRFQARLFRSINAIVPHWREGKNGVNRLNLRLKESVLELPGLHTPLASEVEKALVRERFAASNREFLTQWAPHRQDLLDSSSGGSEERDSSLSPEHVEELLAKLLEALLADHLQSDKFLEREDARTLMVLYRKFRRSRPDDHEGAMALLRLAVRAHPQGPQIKNELRQFDEERGDEDPAV